MIVYKQTYKFTGKRMQCPIFAIREWRKFVRILGNINYMGFIKQLHHHHPSHRFDHRWET